MDFNLILLFVGLGLLGIVILFALWGFLGGLKRELSCIAVFLVLLVLAWLVFGNSGVLLNYSGAGVNQIRDMLNLPAAEGTTIWQSIIEYLKNINGLNLENLLVEGKETYNLIYSIASCVATLVLLISCTLVVVIITPIIRLLSHLVLLIIKRAKKEDTKKQNTEGTSPDDSTEGNKELDEEANDAVLVLKGVEGANDAVITVTENELPEPKKTKKRAWGAVAGALKGIFLIILLFAPISGICAILRTASPETRQTISNLVNGDTTKQDVDSKEGPADIAFDFVDSYGKSAIGKFVESSSYFFGQSFSTLLFDSMSKINTTKQTITLREELSVYLETLNQLNGNIDLGTWTDEEVSAALETLKSAKLLAEIMPVAIEYASEIKVVSDALANAVQTAPFLGLRDIDWKNDVNVFLDTLKEVYKLDIFPLEDFNVLTMDSEKLSAIVNVLGNSEFINKVLPIAIRTGVKLDVVEKITGGFNEKLSLDNVNWKQELQNFVTIYSNFQKYGYTEISQITDLETKELVQKFVVDEFQKTVDLFDSIANTTIFASVLIPVGQSALDYYFSTEDNGFTDFANILNLKELTIDDWKQDFKTILESGKLAVEKLNALSLDLKKMDLTSDNAIETMKEIVKKVLKINLLGDDTTKNNLLLAVFNKFDLFNEEDLYIYEVDAQGNKKIIGSILDNINWVTDGENLGEIDTILNLIDVYSDFTKLKDVDMKELKFDFQNMLEDDEAIDVMVEALEELVDSDLALALINPATNKYLLPITDKFDDDNVVKDIMNSIREKALAEEIIKIVQAIKDAQTLGLFEVARDGIGALKYQEVDAMINIIDTIFQSKIFQGFEGRIIRIILKATKLLEVEKGLLNDIDYTGERDLLVNFIREVEPILKDPEFSLVDDSGNVKVDLDYLTRPEIFAHLMSGVEIIFGTYEINEDGTYVETKGSKLVAALLPSIYVKYLRPLVPEEFKELLDIIDIETLSSETLARDVKRLVYIAGELVEMDAQTLLSGGSVVYTDKLENFQHIIDALLDIEMFKRCGNEVFAWTINYLADKFAGKLNIEKVSAEDFKDVDWKQEGATAKAVIKEIINFLEVNDLQNTEKLIQFFKDKTYMHVSFVTTENVNTMLNIVNTLLDLQTIECVLPIAFQVGVNQLITANIIEEDFWNGELTGVQLVEDLHSVLNIADVLINEMDFVEYWRNGFKGDIFMIPESSSVNKVLDELFAMNIVKGYEARLVQYAVNKYLPENKIITAADIDASAVENWETEVQAFENIIAELIKIVKDNNFTTVGQIVDLINEYKNDKTVVNKYITDTNIGNLSNVVEAARGSELVTNILPTVLKYGLSLAKDAGYNVDFLNDLTAAELNEDLHVVAEMIKLAASEGVACVILKEQLKIDTKPINTLLENAKTLVGLINQLNLVTKHENELVSTLVNKGFEAAKLTSFYLEASDLEDVNWNDDFQKIQNVLTHLQQFAVDNNLISLVNLVDYINNVKGDFKVALTDANANCAVEILRELAETGLVKALLPQGLDYAIELAVENGYDISFIKLSELTNEELANDIITLTYVVVDLIDLHAIEIYNGKAVSQLNENALQDIPVRLAELHILGKYANDWMAFVTNYVLDKVIKISDFEERYDASDFEIIASADWKEDAESLGSALVSISKVLDELFPDGFTIKRVQDFVQQQLYKEEEYLTDTVIDNLFDALSSLVGLNSTQPILSDFVDYGIQKAKDAKFDVAFVKESATNKNLSADIQVLGEIVKEAVHFGAVKLLNKEYDKEQINTAYIANIIGLLDQMNIYNMNRAEVWTLILNKVFEATKVTVTVEVNDFAYMTEENWVADNTQLQLVVNMLQELLTTDNKLSSVYEIREMITSLKSLTKDEKDELLDIFLKSENVTLIGNILHELFKVNGFDAFLNDLVGYGVDQLNKNEFVNKLDINFVKDVVTNEILSHDVLNISEIVNIAVEFGLLEYLKTSDIADINLATLDPAFDQLNEMLLLKEARVEWMALLGNVLGTSLKFDTKYSQNDFTEITDQDADDAIVSVKEVLVKLDELLAMWKLESLKEVIDFIKKQGYMTQGNLTVDTSKIATSIISTIADIKPIHPLLPNIVRFAVQKVPAEYDVSFILQYLSDGTLNGTVLAEDIKTLMLIANDALDFGALDIYFGVYKEQPFEIKFEYISSIVEKLDTLHILEADYNNWIALVANKVLAAIKIDRTITIEELSYMENEMWHEDFARLVAIIDSVAKLSKDNNLTFYDDIVKFFKDKGYESAQYVTNENINTVLDIVDQIVVANSASVALEKMFSYAITKYVLTNDKLPDLEFVRDAIQNGEYVGSDIRQDLLTVSSMIREAVRFGAVEIFYDKKVSQIDVAPLQSIVKSIDELALFHISEAEWTTILMNQVLKAIKMDETHSVTVDEYEFMNQVDYTNDLENIAVLIGQIGDLLKANYLESSEQVVDFFKNKNYELAQYATEENVNSITSMLRTIAEINGIVPILDELALYAIDKVNQTKLDLTFLETKLNNKQLTGTMLSQDINTLANIIDEAVSFGALDYFFYKEIEDLELSILAQIVEELRILNTLNVARADWTALITNEVLKAMKITDRVEVSDYAYLTETDYDNCFTTLVEIINKVDELLDNNNIDTLEQINNFFNDKLWQLAQYANSTNANAILDIVDLIGTLKALEPALPALANYLVQKVSTDKFKLSFMSLYIGKDIDGVDLASDIRTIASMGKDLVQFGVLDYYFYKSIDVIDFSKLTDALNKLDELHIYKVDEVNWLVIATNKLLEAIKSEDRVSVSDFAGLDPEQEISHLVAAINQLDKLFKELNIVSTDDAQNFIANKNYLNGQYVNETTVNISIEVVDELAQMQIFRVVLPSLASFGVSKIDNNDLDFLKEALSNKEFTADELISDVRTVLDIARKGVEFGVFDALFNIEVEHFDGEIAASMIAQIEEINLFTRLRSNWVAYALNKALVKLNIEITASEFDALTEAEWLEDNVSLQNAVKGLCELMNSLGLMSKSAVQQFINNKDYLGETMFSDANMDSLNVVLNNLLVTNTANIVFDKVLNYAITKAAEKGFDIAFLEHSYTALDLANDIQPILIVAKNLASFGIKEYINDKEISHIDVTYIANAVAKLENMNLFTKFRSNWTASMLNKLFKTMKFDVTVDSAELTFTEAEWLEENATLQALVLKLGEILDNNNLESYSEVVRFFKEERRYSLEETYTDSNLTLIAEAMKLVLSFHTADVIFPQVLDEIINKADKAGLDIHFLEGTFTSTVLMNDIDTLVQMFRPLCKFGLFDIIESKKVELLNIESLKPAVELIPSLGLYQLSPADWAASLINFIAVKAKLDMRKVTASEFATVDWNLENQLFLETMTAVDKFLVETDLALVENIKELINNKFKPSESYATSENANYFVKALESLANLQTFGVITTDFVRAGLTKLNEKQGLDYTYVLDSVTNEQVLEDVRTLLSAAYDLIDFGMVEIIIRNVQIDYNNKAALYSALEKVLNLHMLVGNDNKVIITTFDKYGINSALATGNVKFSEEYDNLVNVLDNAFVVLENYGLYTIPQIKAFDFKSIKFDRYSDENMLAVANIIDTLQKSDLFKFVIMPLSDKYLSKDNLEGIADLHNIYSNVNDLSKDLHDVSMAIVALANLHVYDFLVGNIDYPYNNKLDILNIIDNVFELNYFNMPGRMDAFVKGLDRLLGSVDLSEVNGNNIDLAGDVSKIHEVYEHLSAVLGQEGFPIKNKYDVDNNGKAALKFLLQKSNIAHTVDAVNAYMDTTLYGETGATLLILALPLFKNILNDYWVALDLDNYNGDKVSHDTPYLKELIETVLSLDLVKLSNGNLDLAVLDSKIDVIIDNINALELFKGHMNSLVELLLRDLVYGKKIAGKVVPADSFNVENVDFENDNTQLKELVHLAVKFFASVNVYNLNEVKDYVKNVSVKELASDNNSMMIVADMLDVLSNVTFVNENLKTLYELYVVPALENRNLLKYFDYRDATNEEMVADLAVASVIVRDLVDINAGKILNGEVIEYVNSEREGVTVSEIVSSLVNVLGTTNYIKYHTNTYLEILAKKVKGITVYGASYDNLDVQGDLVKFADAYAILAEYFNSSDFTIKTINDIKSIDFKELIKGAYNHITDVMDAYDIFVTTSIAPYFLPTLVNQVRKVVPTKLKGVVDVVDAYELTLEQLTFDIAKTSKLFRDLVETNVVDYLINKTALLPENNAMSNVVYDVLDLTIVNLNYRTMLKELMKVYNIDATDVDFDIIDVASDRATLQVASVDALITLKAMNLTHYEDVLDLIRNISYTTLREKMNGAALKALGRTIESIADTSLGYELLLPFTKKVLTKVTLPEKYASLQTVLTLDKYNKVTFNEDIQTGLVLAHLVKDSGIYKYWRNRNEAIDWTNEYADEMIRVATTLHALSLYGQDVVEAFGTIMNIDLSAFDNSNIDYSSEAEAYVNAYNALTELLMRDDFPVRTLQDIIDVLRKRTTISKKYFINYEPATLLINALSKLDGTSLSGELYSVMYAFADKLNVPGSRFLETSELSALERIEDYATLLNMAQSAVNFIYNDGKFVRVGKDSSLENTSAAVEIIDYLMNLHVFEGKYAEILEAAFNKYGIDTSLMELTEINYMAEAEYAKAGVVEVLTALHEYGITSFRGLVDTAKEYYNVLKASKKEFARKVKDMLITIDVEHIVNFVEVFDQSELADEILLPVYEKVLNKYGSKFGNYEQYLHLDGYTKEALESDTHIAASAIRTLYTSQFYKAYTQNAELTDEQIALVQKAIRELATMQILEVKKQDVVMVVNQLIKRFDLSTLDFTSVNVAHDGNIVADMVPAIYTVYKNTNKFKLNMNSLGNTELMNALIDIYELYLEMDTSDVVTPWVARKVLARVDSMLNTNRFADTTDAQIENLSQDVLVALRALSSMGAFSNDGIDFTNKELTDKVFAVVYNNVRLGSYERYFDKLTRNIAELGIVHVDYSVLHTREEIKVYRAIANKLRSFLASYKSDIRGKNYAIVSDVNFQNDLTDLIVCALDSDLIEQVFMDGVVYLSKALTENYGKVAVFEGMTSTEFVNVALPDLFKMATLAEKLGVFDKKINYKDTETIIALAEFVTTSVVTKDLLNDLLPIAAKKVLKANVTKQELVNANVDYEYEVECLKAFLNAISSELQNVTLSDVNTMLTKEFLLAVSSAGKELETSKLAKLFMKRIMKKAINKVSSTTNVLDFMLSSLDSPLYTDDYAMADYMSLLNVIEEAAYINFFGSEGLDYANLDGHIDILLTNLFGMYAVEDHEEEVMRMVLDKLTFVDTSSLDLTVVNDWDNEFAQFVLMTKSLATLCADPEFDINNMNSSMFENEAIQDKFVAFVDAASKSYVGSELFKELYETKVEANLPEDAQGIIDLDTLPNEKWAEEFEKLFDVYVSVKQGLNNLSLNEALSVYDSFFGLNGKPGLESVKANYNRWLGKFIDKVSFKETSEGFRINKDAIPTNNEEARLEVIAVRNVIANFGEYIDPVNEKVSDISYSKVSNLKDYEKISTTLITLSKSLTMREILLGIIGDTITSVTDTSGESSFQIKDLVSDEFWSQYYDTTSYDETFWTEEQLVTFAIFVAAANAKELRNSGNANIYTMDLGTNYPNVSTYNNVVGGDTTSVVKFPSQEDSTNTLVGLRQLLQLMNVSNIFDVNQLCSYTDSLGVEHNGIIAKILLKGNIISTSADNYRPLGTVTNDVESWNEEIIAMTDALQSIKDNGLLVVNASYTSTIAKKAATLDEASAVELFTKINNSTIIRPMLPSVLYDALKIALVNNGLTEADAELFISRVCPELAEQNNPATELMSKEEYASIIQTVASLIESQH